MAMNKSALRVVTGGTDFDRSPVARYIQLATLFRNRIAAGEWPVGSRIPNVEGTLAAEFAVARGTMREALGLLGAGGAVGAPARQGHLRAQVADRGACFISWRSTGRR